MIDIVNEARSWVGTRFKHQGRIKKNKNDLGGCDCLGLIMGLNIKTISGDNLKFFDEKNYPKLINSNKLLDKLNILLEKAKKIEPGNIIVIRVNNWPQHLAIVTNVDPEITIIHSYLQAKKIVEQNLSKQWEIVAAYTTR